MATVKFVLYKPYKDRKTHPARIDTSKDESLLNDTKKAKKTDRPLNPEETRLYLYLIIDRDHVIKVKTEHKILPREWDFKRQLKKEIKGNLPGTPELNKKVNKFNKGLLELKDEILLKYQSTIKDFPDLAFNQVAKTLTDYGKAKEIPFNNNDKSFFDVLEDYIKFLEGEVAPRTIKKFVTLKKSLKEFIQTNKKYDSLSFSMIDHSFKDAYIRYLRNQKPRGRQKNRPEDFQTGLLNDTTGKYIKTLKTFCAWAEERTYNKFTIYKDFKNTTGGNKKREKQDHDIVTLTLPELKQFYSFDFSDKPSLERVRDLFCFGAFTGQRWSDIEGFDKSQLHGDVWIFTAYKTKKETEIDLTGYAAPALDILKKYDYQLPKISLTKFNLFIKDAAETAGINTPTKIRRYVGANEIIISKLKYKFIGSHTARKTCVSILLNDYNLNITHVLEITGHSDLKTLQKYINKDRQARRDAISKTKSITEIMTVVKSKTG
jgi:integrase